MDINYAFGKALKEIRHRKGISQEKFAAASRSHMSLLERGIKSPTLSTVDKLSKELDIHPLWLLLNVYAYRDDVDLEELCNQMQRHLKR